MSEFGLIWHGEKDDGLIYFKKNGSQTDVEHCANVGGPKVWN